MQTSTSRLLALLFTGTLMGALDISIVGPAIPSIAQTLGVDDKSLSWVFSIYMLFSLIGIAPMAKLSDFLGRRAVYTAALIIFMVGSALVAFSESYTLLLVGRAVQGIGVSGIFPIASATIGDVIPLNKRGRALGMIGMVFGLAFIMGPVIAGIVLNYFEWNALFLINLPVCAVLIFYSLRILPTVSHGTMAHFDWKGILSLAIFLATFTLSVNMIRPDSLFQSLLGEDFLALFGISMLSLAFFITIENTAREPVMNLRNFRRRQVSLAGFIAFGTGLFQASLVFFPKMAISAFGVDPSRASFMLIPSVLAVAIGAPLGGRLLDRTGPRPIIIAGLTLSIIGLFMMSRVTDNTWLFYSGGAALGMGLSFLVGSSLRYIILSEASDTERASSQGMLAIFGSIGQILGAIAMGSILGSFPGMPGYRKALLIFAVTTIVFLIASFYLKRGKYLTQKT